ncbi:hypothetical protein FC83_GL001394 [Agrilactobacillus composti DSM 18527 = JCM 14202]|uniref:N-acetyltransferase domain-containing protein n=1 Tax=Agrilactobacillus composti DSM 18527 = JCM 14202 TaxID=1423734 RepID=X0PEG1_9LACO|nr:GNAT family N-acetyltransferase [Agrilactobacillus composti]KRM30836.1 hypothetical protein FC83_GL001394 [Agrilactobacillus composti DSM 18527 = JCM 14202]GAF39838.1 putative acetyltransferase [Agrilactobacillus composti DSM 18527 = JCM 14202]
MIFETKRLYTRPLIVSDIVNLNQTLMDVQAMYAYAHAFKPAEVLAWYQRQVQRYQQDGFGLWALIRKEDQQFVGQCGLTKQTFNGAPIVEIGYLLQRDFWHHGYAIEAARAAKQYAFEQLELARVWSVIRDNNLASMNVAIRNGMLVRGKEIKHYYGLDMPHFGFAVDQNKSNSNS